MQAEAQTKENQNIEEIKWQCTKWVLLIGIPFLILFLIEYNAGVIDFTNFIQTEWQDSSRSASKDAACIDGYVYDTSDAPIYNGSLKKEAQEVRDFIRPILKKKGYEGYTDILVSICYVESTFGKTDNANWMQVKNYNGASGIESVKAGITHFINLIENHAIPQNCTDINVLIQAYNYGQGYIEYCMAHGGKDTQNLRVQFQISHDDGDGYGNSHYQSRVQDQIKGEKKIQHRKSKKKKKNKKRNVKH